MYKLNNLRQNPEKALDGKIYSWLDFYTAFETKNLIDAKQNILAAGPGVNITNDTISFSAIDDSSLSSDLTYSSEKISSLLDNQFSETKILLTEKQDKIDVIEAPINLDFDNITNKLILSFEKSGVIAGTYGSSGVDKTRMPVVSVDKWGRVTDIQLIDIYPPQSTGEHWQYWMSDGSEMGIWQTSGYILPDSEALVSGKTIYHYLTSFSSGFMNYKGNAKSEDDISPEPNVFYLATGDFTFGEEEEDLLQVIKGDWLLFNRDNIPSIWPFHMGYVTGVNGSGTGEIIIYGQDIGMSTEDTTSLFDAISNNIESISILNYAEETKTLTLTLLTYDSQERTKEIILPFDNVPTALSNKFVTSGAIYQAILEATPDIVAGDNVTVSSELQEDGHTKYTISSDQIVDDEVLSTKTYSSKKIERLILEATPDIVGTDPVVVEPEVQEDGHTKYTVSLNIATSEEIMASWEVA